MFVKRWRAGSIASIVFALSATARGQTIDIDTSAAGRQQIIDGFGTCLYGTEAQSDWWKALYFDDLGASVLRFDIVPRFKTPYSDYTYNSPWFHNSPALPGPDGNNVRTYTNATDYSRSFAGRNAQIAVMGPDIDQNILYFDYNDDVPKTAGLTAQAGNSKKAELGDFKLFASMWSPPPWLKLSSGNAIDGQSGIYPVNGTPWPFIWGGNFSGGVLDTSGTPRAEFDDSSQGGTGPTSALTQFARALAAYLRGFQQTYGVNLYAISIQNELNFETFYNSCSYPLSDGYIAALKAARAELDQYDDLRGIRIMGPEDLLGGDAYGMWQYGGGTDVTHKNLQYLANIAADSAAASALDFFCIHGYASDGVSSAGASATEWAWWVDGWTTSPAAGIPDNVQGFSAFGKKSWMTETSGEDTAWLSPGTGYPSQGAFSIAVKLHQALTQGQESAWVYWQLSDGSTVGAQTLTDATAQGSSAKYVAVKHFYRYIRPGAVRVSVTTTGADSLLASAYVHDADGTLTVVLVNTSPTSVSAGLTVPSTPSGITSFAVYTSSDGNFWQSSSLDVANGSVAVSVPGYGVVTLYGQGTPMPVPDGGVGGSGGVAGSGATGGAGSLDASAGGGTPTGTGGETAAGGSTASGGNSTVGGSAASDAQTDGSLVNSGGKDSGGCGCRSSRRAPDASWSWILALTATLAGRARARRGTRS